jgi:hypothetical protein
VFQACLDREIQSGAIGTSLAVRYDFSKHFDQLVASALQFGQLLVNPFVRQSFQSLSSKEKHGSFSRASQHPAVAEL